MPRRRQRDREALAGIIDALRTSGETSGDGRRPILDEIAAPIGRLVGMPKVLTYGLAPTEHGLHVDFMYGCGVPVDSIRREFQALVTNTPRSWALYDPFRPEPVQRGHAFTFPQLDQLSQRERPSSTQELFDRNGIGHDDQLRILVCDGESLLAWVGGFRPEAFGARERWLLQALDEPLRERLSLERQLGNLPLTLAALGAALEAIGRAAWVVTGSDVVVHANAAGRAMLDGRGAETRAALGRLADPDHGSFSVTRLRAPGAAEHRLCVLRRPPGQVSARLTRTAALWALTPRQADVLSRVVRGEGNRTIAAALHCAESTVEQHVTALLAKASCDGRAALVARFFKE